MKARGELIELGHHLPARLGHTASRHSVTLALSVHGAGEKSSTDTIVVQVHLGAGFVGVLTVVLVDEFAAERVSELHVVRASRPHKVTRRSRVAIGDEGGSDVGSLWSLSTATIVD